ncbi:hypothetical protein NKH54_26250 [Mesorhizobium sp. M1004]|uniref:hypothetical protein n=1 Tax=Mesorhizobium sp. M1004 TaxID=2957046 RepID=UPI0033393100
MWDGDAKCVPLRRILSGEARRETAYVMLGRVQGFGKLGRINRFTRSSRDAHR